MPILKKEVIFPNIPKEITFHTARHILVTSVTSTSGVPIETVRKMLGHKNILTSQHYSQILDKKVIEEVMIFKITIIYIF